MNAPIFRNRGDAGRRLAECLDGFRAERGTLLVLALPRGGVPVAFEVAGALHAPLDVLIVRKLGVPGHAEYAMGAIAAGVRILNDDVVRRLGIPDAAVDAATRAGQSELTRRESLYRAGRPPIDVRGSTVLVVDDGLATGSTMRSAVQALRAQAPARIVVAVPTAPADVVARLRGEVDEVVCVSSPEPFRAVGQWYADFSQTTDWEVTDLLERARSRHAA